MHPAQHSCSDKMAYGLRSICCVPSLRIRWTTLCVPSRRQLVCLLLGILFAVILSAFYRHPALISFPECREIYEQSFANSQRQKRNGQQAKLLCYINTHPNNYAHKAMHSRYTWARHCDKFIFTSTKDYPDLPVLKIDMEVPEVKLHLWVKMRKILREIYKLADQYDFFLKADDDAHVVIESIREALLHHSPDEAFMTGFRWPTVRRNGYFSGGPGYILSRSALKRIVDEAIDKHPRCPTTDEDMEDVKLSICGEAVGVKLLDTVAETDKSIFYPYQITRYFDSIRKASRVGALSPYNLTNPYLRRIHLGLSRRHAGFHYVDKDTQYIIEFISHFLRPVGL